METVGNPSTSVLDEGKNPEEAKAVKEEVKTFAKGKFKTPKEAIAVQEGLLGKGYGVEIKIDEGDPTTMKITQKEPIVSWMNLYKDMNQIQVAQEKEAQKKEAQEATALQSPATSQIPESAVAVPTKNKSYASRLLDQVATLFKSPDKLLRHGGRSV